MNIFVFLYMLAGFSNPATEKNGLSLTISYNGRVPVDSLYLRVLTGELYDTEKTYGTGRDAGGVFRFTVPSGEKRGKFSVIRKAAKGSGLEDHITQFFSVTNSYYWEAGDELKADITPWSDHISHTYSDHRVAFSGPSGVKYAVRFRMDSAFTSPQFIYEKPDTVTQFRSPYRLKLASAWKVLENSRPLLSERYYALYLADLLAACNKQHIYLDLEKIYHERWQQADDQAKANYIAGYWQLMAETDRKVAGIKSEWLAQSEDYTKYCWRRVSFENLFQHGKENHDENFKAIAAGYSGPLRDKVWLHMLNADTGEKDIMKLYGKVQSAVQDSCVKKELVKLRGRLPGSPVYPFALQDEKGKMVAPQQFSGKTLFVDFWFTGCGACTWYYQQCVNPAKKQLAGDTTIVFLSVSIDKGRSLWEKSLRSGLYTTSGAVNLITNGEGSNHEMIRFYQLSSFPQFMIIRPDGKVHRFYPSLQSPDIATADALAKTLRAVSYQ